MLFKEFGKKELPTIILLHGGGLSWWSYNDIMNQLQNDYHVVTPIIDGYGEDEDGTFISIEDSARKLVEYINMNYHGKVYALGGLSLGAQIVVEVLSNQTDITQYAIIESALVFPIRGTRVLTVPICKMSYGLIKKRWFSKLQAKELFVPNQMFEEYYKDSIKMSKQTLINTILSNGTYELKDEISNTKSKVLVLVGEREVKIEKKSAEAIHKAIPNSELYVVPNMKHGEMSLVYPAFYVKKLLELFHT